MTAPFKLICDAAGASLAAMAMIAAMAAQAPQGATGRGVPQSTGFAAPTNLKALPRGITGQQVHDLMEQWQAALGTRCNSCHAEDREKTDPDGRPVLDFAADSKPMKEIARIMFRMTEEINNNYVARIDGSGIPVTCGTCHRGHLGPEPYPIPSDAGSDRSSGAPSQGEKALPE